MEINIKSVICCLLFLFFTNQLNAQINGKLVLVDRNTPIIDASISSVKQNKQTKSNSSGNFTLSGIFKNDTLKITHLGFRSLLIPASRFLSDTLEIFLEADVNIIDEVLIETGYQSISEERATGSFTFINNDLLNRSASSDIISRLENVTNGLSFNRSSTNYEESIGKPELRVRGISSIYSDTSPLIVVDNFPYDGNIEDINPNDVDNITILKDASAASIWGARAGNGVIVIKTKKGSIYQKNSVQFNANSTITSKPNLFYNQSFLPSEIKMEIEEGLFDKGAYSEQDHTPIPEYIELLIAKRDGGISEDYFHARKNEMIQQDIRKDSEKHLYNLGINQQYALNLSGGDRTYTYYLSGSYDNQQFSIKKNKNKRYTLASFSTIKPYETLKISIGLNLNQIESKNNGLTISSLNPTGFDLSPYTRLLNSNGETNNIVKNYRFLYTEKAKEEGLLDWSFNPLNEINQSNKTSTLSGIRINTSIEQKILNGLDIALRYQYHHNNGNERKLFNEETYHTRDLVNRFTQSDGTKIIPYGSILENSKYQTNSHFGRIQLDYQEVLEGKHSIKGLIGSEIRQEVNSSNPGIRLFNYDDEIINGLTLFNYQQFYAQRPQGVARIPAPPNQSTYKIDRFLSYYLNTSYQYNRKYLLSLSSRWDASNLFGVKANQKGVPLWSLGGSWTINEEGFYKIEWLPYIRTKFTFGYNGNVNKTVSTMPIVIYQTDNYTGLRSASLRSTGNPGLIWEKVRIMNAGIDFGFKNNRLTGSIEVYRKKASDLIGYDNIDPTTGIFSANGRYEIDNRINYANLNGRGIDLEFNSKNLEGYFSWYSTIFINLVNNKVTKYMAEESPSILSFFPTTGNSATPFVGRSLDVIYSLPWGGLNSENGDPVVYINGDKSSNYADYFNSLSPIELINSGVTIPTRYGSIINTFSWKSFSASVNVTWKGGYKFRRPSIDYSLLLNGGSGHMDYLNRWRESGDEQHIQIPSEPNIVNVLRDRAYLFSEQLIEKGNHIRLQDINISYNIKKGLLLPNASIRIFSYLNNLGILWRANKHGIDPDYPLASYPPSLTASFGITANF